ncbi:c-type cytochrome domain-containing protein [Gimesia fumaroli]|uniref:Chromosome partition protein Smc n=1 Tax=Gimesia fumaroli TaxID=2527976 RepID=A0A518I818_9PLAN|nr:c-type cytochrome domain-containing protein [Gimesia fumaroli]QDV49253.1 Chromosome partition protein Smc [Gimesia fumaroli]
MRNRFANLCVMLAAVFAAGSIAAAEEKPIKPAKVELGRPVSFEKDVFPILDANCIACHNVAKKEGSLVLENVKDLIKGGDSGASVVPGKPDESYLYNVAARVEESFMPPLPNKVGAKALTPQQVGILRQWIIEGAKSSGKSAEAGVAWQSLPPGLNSIYATALSPWARYAAVGRANRIAVYDLTSGTEVAALNDPALVKLQKDGKPFYPQGAAHRDFVHSLAFNSDGSLLASGGYRVVKLWKKSLGNVVKKIDLPAAVTSMALNADRSVLAVATADNSASLWKLPEGKKLVDLKGHAGEIKGLSFTPDRSKVVTSSADQSLRVWNAADGKQISTMKTPAVINALTVSKDGAQVIAGAANNIIYVWALTIPAPKAGEKAPEIPAALYELKGHAKPVSSVKLVMPAGTQLVSGSEDGTVRVWDLNGKKQIRSINHGAPVTDVDVSPDAKNLVSVSVNGTGKIWQLSDGKMLKEFRGDLAKERQLILATEAQTVEKQKVALGDAAVKAADKNVKDREAELKKRTEELAAAKKALPEAKKKADESTKKVEAAKAEQAKLLADHKKKGEDAVKAASAQKAAADKAVTDADAKLKQVNQQNQTAIAAVEKEAAAAKKALDDANAVKPDPKDKDAEQKKKDAIAKAKTAFDAVQKKLGAAKQKKTTDEKQATQAIQTAKQAVAKATAAVTAATKLAASKPDTKAIDKKVADAEAEAKKLADAATAAEKKITSSERSVKVAETTLTKIKGQLAERTKEKAALDASAKKLDAALEEAKKQAAVLTPIKAVAFSEDGKQVVTGDDSKQVRVWDTTTGKELDTLAGHTAAVSAVEYTSKTIVVSGSADKTILIQSLQPVWSLIAQLGADTKDPMKVGGSPITNRALCLDFSPDGKLLAVGGGDPSRSGEVILFDVATGKVVRKLENAHSDTVLGLKFSRTGKSLLTGAADKFVKIFDVATGKFVKSFEGHTHHVLDVAWKADESTIVSAGADNVIKVWNIETGEQKRTISGYSKQVTSISFLGLGANIVSGGGDKTVRMHLTTNGKNYRNLSGSTDYVYSVAGSRDEAIVIAGGEDGILRIWDAKTGKLLNSFNPPAVSGNQQASAGK